MQKPQEMQVLSLGLEDPLEEGHGSPLQYSHLENPTDTGVHRVAKSQIWWKRLSAHISTSRLHLDEEVDSGVLGFGAHWILSAQKRRTYKEVSWPWKQTAKGMWIPHQGMMVFLWPEKHWSLERGYWTQTRLHHCLWGLHKCVAFLGLWFLHLLAREATWNPWSSDECAEQLMYTEWSQKRQWASLLMDPKNTYWILDPALTELLFQRGTQATDKLINKYIRSYKLRLLQ